MNLLVLEREHLPTRDQFFLPCWVVLRYGLERKACNCPSLRSFGWVSYDKVGVLYSGKLGNGS